MTCIVGIEHDNRVFLAGDKQGTDHNLKLITTEPKVFVKYGVAYGYAGSYRFGQILEHHLTGAENAVPTNDESIYEWLVLDLVPSIRRTFKEQDFVMEDRAEILIGAGGQLWIMDKTFSVLRPRLGYHAIGAGQEYALGSLFTSYEDMPVTAEGIRSSLALAIKAAGTFCPSVGTSAVFVTV